MVSFYPAMVLQNFWNIPLISNKTIQEAYREIRNIFKGNPSRSTKVQREKITKALDALHQASPLMLDTNSFRRHINPQKKFTFEDFGLKSENFSIEKPAHDIPDLKGFLAEHSNSLLENNFNVELHETGALDAFNLFAKSIINDGKTSGILEIKFDLKHYSEAKAKKTLVLYATHDGIKDAHSNRPQIQNLKVYGTLVDNALLKQRENIYQKESAEWRQKIDEALKAGKTKNFITQNIKNPELYHPESALAKAKAISIQDCPTKIKDLIKNEIVAANKNSLCIVPPHIDDTMFGFKATYPKYLTS